MKHSLIIALIAIAITGIFSCTKSEPIHSQPSLVQSDRTIITDLMSVTFEPGTDDNGNSFLQANRNLDGITSGDIHNHHAFLYAIKSVGDPQIHKLVPYNITSVDQDLVVSYGFEGSSISLRVDNSTPSDQAIDAGQFQNIQFQLILVSNEDYARLYVDWSDYFAVMHALRSLRLPNGHLDDSDGGNH